jgi:hypothetical protein
LQYSISQNEGAVMQDQEKPDSALGTADSQWGKTDAQHFGYESDEDRKAKRGLEDWELVEKIPDSQKPVPYWFFAVVVVVLLVAIGLSLLRLVHGPHVRLAAGRPAGFGSGEVEAGQPER